MKKKTLISALFLAAGVGAIGTANAAAIPALDGVWMSTRLQTWFAKNYLVKHTPAGNPIKHELVSDRVHVDSGKDKCYGFLWYDGAGASPFYELTNFCVDSAGNWISYDNNTHFDLTSPTSGSRTFISNDWGIIQFNGNGISSLDGTTWQYLGITIFEYKIKDAKLTAFNLKTQGPQGTARLNAVISGTRYAGTSKANLTFNWIKDPSNTNKLPTDAVLCKNIFLGTVANPGGRFAHCD